MNSYKHCELSDFSSCIGIIITNLSNSILTYNSTANEIFKFQLCANSDLLALIKLDQSSFIYEQLNYIEKYNCYIVRQMNSNETDFLIFKVFPKTVADLILDINSMAAEYELVFEQSSDGIFITDGAGVILNVNPADEKKCMMKREEMIGKNITELVEGKVFYPSTVLRVLESKTSCTITQRTQNGQTVICTGIPIFDEEGNIIRVLCNNVDYSEIIELKEKLEVTERLQRYYQHTNLEHYRKFFIEGFYVKNEKMLKILDIIENMSEIDPTVLICGKSGVGKSILAKKIHLNSPMKNGAFIEINCGAIPANLLESELFGYVKGAFTGANVEGKAGLIELANNGTLFLDEIGDLPLDLQVKLLHVIQSKKIRRVGSTKDIEINTRIISASNKDLNSMISSGLFREDLYYRLNVVPILIPSLNERKEEIPELLNIYVKYFNEKYRLHKKFDSKTLYHLVNYSWPGNIRELVNIVERLMVTSQGESIMPHELPSEILDVTYDDMFDFELTKTLDEMIDSYEKEILIRIMERTRNSYEIAKILGIGQSSVIRKLQKYNLNGFLSGKTNKI